MKTIAHLVAGIALAAIATVSSAQVGVSVTVGQPGFYGTISIGSAPPPPVVYPNPVVIQASPVPMEPIYLHVPPEQHKHWRKYCARYNACNRPVYFVDHNWYEKVYVPHYQGHRAEYERYQERREDRRDHDGRRGEHREGEERRYER